MRKSCCYWDGSDLWPDKEYRAACVEFEALEESDKCNDCPLKKPVEANHG